MATFMTTIFAFFMLLFNVTHDDNISALVFKWVLLKSFFIVGVPLLTIGRNQNMKNHLFNKYIGSYKQYWAKKSNKVGTIQK
jgi:hypothetical protein